MRPTEAVMDLGRDVARLLGFLLQGSSTNWWGLGCPAHCSGSLLRLCLWSLDLASARASFLDFSFSGRSSSCPVLGLPLFRSPRLHFPRPRGHLRFGSEATCMSRGDLLGPLIFLSLLPLLPVLRLLLLSLALVILCPVTGCFWLLPFVSLTGLLGPPGLGKPACRLAVCSQESRIIPTRLLLWRCAAACILFFAAGVTLPPLLHFLPPLQAPHSSLGTQ